MTNLTNNAQQSLESKALVLVISFGRFGNHKKMQADIQEQMIEALEREEQAETDENKKADQHERRRAMISARKQLLISPELEAIATFDRETDKMLKLNCVDSSLLKGAYFVPLAKVEPITLKLERRMTERSILIDAFCSAYETRVLEAQGPLGTAWDLRNYRKNARGTFRMEWRWLTMDVPGRLKEISASVFEQEREKAAKMWADALDSARQLLRENMRELVSHMVDRLQPEADGKPKVFRNSMLANINGFLDTFNSRNITDDAELQELVTNARKLLSGVEPADLRENDSTRNFVQKQFAAIQLTLDGMVQAKPQRRITFADDDSQAAA
jgi:hypothetical protein